MIKLQLASDWEHVKSLLMETQASLTEEDLQFTPGEDEKLIARVAKKIKRNFEDTKGWIESVSGNTGKAS